MFDEEAARFLCVLWSVSITGVPGITPIICDPPSNPTLLILCKINFNIPIPGVLNDKTLFTLSGIITFRKTASSEDQALFAKTDNGSSWSIAKYNCPGECKQYLIEVRMHVCFFLLAPSAPTCQTKKLNGPRIQSGHLSCKVIRYHARTNASIDLRCRASAK